MSWKTKYYGIIVGSKVRVLVNSAPLSYKVKEGDIVEIIRIDNSGYNNMYYITKRNYLLHNEVELYS